MSLPRYLVNDAATQRAVNGIVDAINALGIYAGTGTPEGVVTAGIGSIYRRRDGSTSTSLYVKTSGTGNTGWTAK